MKCLDWLKISKIITIPVMPMTRYEGFPELKKSKNLEKRVRLTIKKIKLHTFSFTSSPLFYLFHWEVHTFLN